MKLFIFLALITITNLFSCNKDKSMDCCTTKDLALTFTVSSESGQDLLDPNYNLSFNETNIDVFYKENGAYKKVFIQNQDLKKNFVIFKNPTINKYILKLFVSEKTDNFNISSTLIQFAQSAPDTIIAELKKSESTITINKALINNNLIDRHNAYNIIK